MRDLYDIQQLLKSFGIIVYVGNRLYDIELMELEFRKLHDSQLVDDKTFKTGLLILKREHRLEMKRQGKEEEE